MVDIASPISCIDDVDVVGVASPVSCVDDVDVVGDVNGDGLETESVTETEISP